MQRKRCDYLHKQRDYLYPHEMEAIGQKGKMSECSNQWIERRGACIPTEKIRYRQREKQRDTQIEVGRYSYREKKVIRKLRMVLRFAT